MTTPVVGFIGLGLMATEILHSRAERQGEERADDREVRALRARIAEDLRGSGSVPLLATRDAGLLCQALEAGSAAPAKRKPLPRSGRLVGGRRRSLINRSGIVGLR